MLKRSIGFNSLVLGTFALITAFLLASTYLGTRDQITKAERDASAKALLEIIPSERHDNDLLTDTLDIPHQYWATLGLNEKDTASHKIHVARQQGKPVAFIVPAIAPDGYSGAIRMIIGINIDGTIAGVRVLSHQETPGLGDKVDLKRSRWILSFNGKSLGKPPADRWKVKKDKGDFDQFTGATITPRAVIGQVLRALQYYEEDQKRLVPDLKAQVRAPKTEGALLTFDPGSETLDLK